MDMIFVARQLRKKCKEMRIHLYSTFVDLKKVFDTVNREGLGRTMQKFVCPKRFTQMLCQLNYAMTARSIDSGFVSGACAVTNGVNQGCVLVPILFNVMSSAMLMDTNRNKCPEIRVVYRTDGQLLNQWRVHFQSRVFTTTVYELFFADGCRLNAISEGDMQRSMIFSTPPVTNSVWSSTCRR
nr:unnamed protein product [Spirometra erinaceieuropaei]